MKKDQNLLKIIIAIAVLVGGYFFLKDFQFSHELPAQDQLIKNQSVSSTQNTNSSSSSIDELTEENKVIDYVKKNHRLPNYYITKKKARKLGWKPHLGNLCDALPGQAIGGDHFGNRERKLPKGNKYFEADVNYNCGNRNADRIVFTKDGEVWLTHNHYKTFTKQ